MDDDDAFSAEVHSSCYERSISYFCWSVAPKLKEIPEFNNLPKPIANPCQASVKQWENAVITILSWADDGTTNVSEKFKDFYNGFLYFRNVHGSIPHRTSLQHQLFDFIFEIYGSDPSGLPKIMCETLNLWESIPKDIWEDSKPNLWNMIKHRDSSDSLVVDALLHYLHCGMSDLRQKIEGSQFYRVTAFFEELGSLYNNPMMEGFQKCVSHALKACRKKLLNMEHGENLTRFDSSIFHEDAPVEVKIRLYVGPSGCGKTHKLHQLLQKQWGLYLLPGNLPPRPQRNSPRLSRDGTLFDELSYRARDSGGSRDTQTLYHDLKAVKVMDQELNCRALAHTRLDTLLKIRLSVLEDFLRVNPEHYTPADWLAFQTSFEDAGRDVFNNLFRIARFHYPMPVRYLTPVYHLAKHPDEKERNGMRTYLPSNLLICMDEAQCDLEERFPVPNDQPFSLFGCTVWAAALSNLQTVNYRNFQLIISGTALQLRPTVEELIIRAPQIGLYATVVLHLSRSASSKPAHIEIPFVAPEFSLESDYTLIVEDSQFRELLEERIPECDEKFERIITVHSRPLRGRYRWSVCYLDDIKHIVKQNKETDDHTFSEQAAECCRRVYVVAKEGLKSRLEDIDGRAFRELWKISPQSNLHANKELIKDTLKRQDRHKKLLDELCWLAVRSDLLGESTIFQSKGRAGMVTLGFAFAEKAGQDGEKIARKIVLKERIAVEAAVEYFQAQRLDGKPSRYDEALKNFLYQEQGNLSALGENAELFFAWHLRKVLRAPEQRVDAILPTFSRRERMDVLKLLVGQSENIHMLLQPGKSGGSADARFETRFGCDPDRMYLIEGSQTAFKERSGSDRSDTVWGWLEMIRTGSSKDSLKSTFWFPSTMAGPDVLFALRRTPSHQRSSLQSMGLDTSGSRKRRRKSGSEPNTMDDSIVLCAVQIKRQSIDHDIPGAILSTSPNHWFRGVKNPEEAKSILRELEKWRKKGHPIVRILVTSLTDPPGDNPRRKKPTQYLKEEMTKPPTRDRFKRKFPQTEGQTSNPPANHEFEDFEDFEDSEIPLDQQYFNWVGAEHDGDLFGAAFKEFNKAERSL